MADFRSGGIAASSATEMPQSLFAATSPSCGHLFRPLVPFNTLVTSIIDRGRSLDDLRRMIIVECVRLVFCGKSNHKHSKKIGRRDWARVIADGESRKGRAVLSLLEGQWTAPSHFERKAR
jgi:hypothetical protein